MTLLFLRFLKASGLAAVCVLGGLAHAAEPNQYVLLPGVTYGERELELLLGTLGPPGQRDSEASLALGVSPTSYWATEVYANFARSGEGNAARFDGVEWENRFQLTEPGEYAIDWGTALEVNKFQSSSEGWDATWLMLMQGDATDRIQWNFNPLLAINWSGASASSTHLGYQAQVKYRYRRELQFGVQGFGDFGPWYHWQPLDQQSHQLGPAVFGQTALGNRTQLLYNAGWLIGLNPAAPHSQLRAQIELEF